MARIIKANGRQWPLVAELILNFGADTVVNNAGVEVPLTGALVSDLIPMPPNGTVIGGEIVVEVASNSGTTQTLSLGDSGNATRYASAVDMKTAARTALTLTGYRGTGEDLRVTLAQSGGAPTAGRAVVRVMYTITDRANENQPN